MLNLKANRPKISITVRKKVVKSIMSKEEFYTYCKSKFALDDNNQVENILYTTTININKKTNDKFDVGTEHAEIWRKEGEDKFIRIRKEDKQYE